MYIYMCIQRNLLGIKFETHFLEIITKEATLKTDIVEPAWADFELGQGKHRHFANWI